MGKTTPNRKHIYMLPEIAEAIGRICAERNVSFSKQILEWAKSDPDVGPEIAKVERLSDISCDR